MQWYCKIAVRLHLVSDPVKTSGLRAARVLENEERIVRAAHQLFVKAGYRATTLAAVADLAGVAPRTVYVRFGTKAALLKRVIEVALVGDLAPVDVVSRDWYQTATSAPTLEARISALAAGSARLVISAADVVAVAREAEPTEPLLAQHAAAGRAETRQAFHKFWTRARDDGLLPPETDVAWLTDTTSLLAHIETYLLMRQMEPATAQRYETWLATTCHRLAAAVAHR
jgi:AcrR family transcriptional regulator